MNACRKAVESAESEAYTLRQPRPAPVLGPYKARINELLAENERLPRKQRYIGHLIYQDIKAQGYTGAESTVRGYIAQRRKEKKRPQVYIPLEFDVVDCESPWQKSLDKPELLTIIPPIVAIGGNLTPPP